jgi:hypothetical protein
MKMTLLLVNWQPTAYAVAQFCICPRGYRARNCSVDGVSK